jgi:hypothetical protein
MPKEFPIRLMVEEIALGTVLRKLHDMPGVVRLDLDFGHGGQGAGRQKLEKAASNDPREAIVKALTHGPQTPKQIAAATGFKIAHVYQLMLDLRRKHLIKAVGGGMSALAAHPELAAPKLKHGAGGRASPGSGGIVLRHILQAAGGPLPTKQLRAAMGKHGMSGKSVAGILSRAKRDGVIKAGANGYSLTTKGSKLNGAAHD